MQRKFLFEIEEYYHVFNRGVERRDVFLNEQDRRRFINLLYLCNSISPVNMREVAVQGDAFVLMREKIENGISVFMKKLGTAYSMYFNTKYSRTGALFERPFKATHASDDRHLKHLYAYIHLNPLSIQNPGWKITDGNALPQISAEKFLREYPHSSYLYYLGNKRNEDVILSTEAFPEYFTKQEDFESLLRDWLQPEFDFNN
ncbi:MAG: Transposase [Candidatus Giovannonibacteria bacterium GW2011_GWB1_46_20]|nr:MAG: Transposase [Candidatus Giovannonibacteria bacterium GW2011_GWB1_46_20]